MKHATRLLLSILAVIDLALGNVISVSSKVHGKPTPAVQVNVASGTTIGSVYCEYCLFLCLHWKLTLHDRDDERR